MIEFNYRQFIFIIACVVVYLLLCDQFQRHDFSKRARKVISKRFNNQTIHSTIELAENNTNIVAGLMSFTTVTFTIVYQ